MDWPETLVSVHRKRTFIIIMDKLLLFGSNRMGLKETDLAPVVQTMDSAIHRINRYPLDK